MQPHWCHSADVNLSKRWPLSVLSKDIRCLFQNMYSIHSIHLCYILGVSFNFIYNFKGWAVHFYCQGTFSPIIAGQGTPLFCNLQDPARSCCTEVFIRRYLRWSLLSCQWTAPRRAAAGRWSLEFVTTGWYRMLQDDTISKRLQIQLQNSTNQILQITTSKQF